MERKIDRELAQVNWKKNVLFAKVFGALTDKKNSRKNVKLAQLQCDIWILALETIAVASDVAVAASTIANARPHSFDRIYIKC